MDVGRLFVSLGLDMANFRTGLENAQRQLQTVGKKMSDIGSKISVGITAPLTLAGGLIINSAMDAESAQGKLQAALGATAEEAQSLGDVAKEVWKSGFGENIDEVTTALTTVKQNMQGIADGELQSITQGAITISQVFGEDVSATTAAASVMMKNFGISGQDALDLMTVGFQKGGNFSGELLDTMREYGPQFAEMGFSAGEMLNTLIKGTQAGAWNMDKIGDSVKEFHLKAQDGSKSTAEGFAAIGLDADEMGAKIAAGGDEAQKAFIATVAGLTSMKDPLAQDAAGVALFGTQWEDVRSKVIAAMGDGTNAIGNFKGATDEASKAMQENNPAIVWTQAFREMQLAVGPILLDVANVVRDNVVPAIKGLSDLFSSLPNSVKVAMVVFIGLIAIIGPLLVAFGAILPVFASVAGGIGAVTAAIAGGATGIGILTTAFPVLGTVMTALTGPIGIVIASITALVAAGVYLYKHWDEIKKKASDIWNNGIKNSISKALEATKKFISNTWNSIKSNTSQIWEGLKQFLVNWWPVLLGALGGPVGVLVGFVFKNFDTIKTNALTIWNGIKSGILSILSSITSGVSSSVSSLVSTVRNGLESAWSYIKSLPSQAVSWGRNIIQGLANGIKSIHIPTPHFSMSTSSKSVGGVSIPIPNFKVNWYDKGGIFTQPSIIGVGEKRPEFVGALDDLRQIVREESGIGNSPIQLQVNLDSRVISTQLYYLQQGQYRGGGLK